MQGSYCRGTTPRLRSHGRKMSFSSTSLHRAPSTHRGRHIKCEQHRLHGMRVRGVVQPVAQHQSSPLLLQAASCPEAQCAQWSAAQSVATPTGLVSTASSAARGGSLVRNRVLKNRKGLFRIRHLQESDLVAVAHLQAASFHEALPVKALDQLSFQMFKAEVLSAVRGKTKVLAEDGFTILVVESCSPAANTWPLGCDSSSSSSEIGEDSSDEDAAVWYGDQQATAGRYGTSHSGSAAAAGTSGAGNTILGVIEVGVQDERDVLQHLPRSVETYAYISSMAVASHVRRCGIGAALLQAAEQQAKLWGQDLLALHVYETNGRAMKLYESHGLANHAADPAWRKFVGGKVRHLMVKRL